MPHREAASTSMGAWPPPALAAQDAWRNSWLVATRSAARVRTRSGSHTTAIEPFGRTSMQQLHVVDEDGGEGLHALHRDPLGDLAEQLAELGVLLGEGRGPGAYVVGEQQLAAGRRPQAVLGDFQGALVGDLEVADLLDVVAPELHAQRVLLGGREHIEDAAADGELAALLDEFDAGVRGGGEALDDVVEVGGLPAAQRDGLQVPEPLDLRL